MWQVVKRIMHKTIRQQNSWKWEFYTIYFLWVNNLSEEDTDEFLRLAMTYLENKSYEVYIGNARYTYKNANQNVQPNELLIAFKNVK